MMKWVSYNKYDIIIYIEVFTLSLFFFFFCMDRHWYIMLESFGFIYLFIFIFLGPHLQHMEVPRLGVELEL